MYSNKRFLCLLLVAVSTIALAMDQQFKRPIPLKSLHVPNIGQSSTSSTPSSMSTDSGLQELLNANTNETFDQADIAEMNLVFNTSPKLAQIIVEHLKDPTYLNDSEYRSAIFAGEPGTGKSMMAQAIAYKMMIEAGWQYKFLPSTQFMEKFRNQTAIRLTQVLQAIKASNKPTLLIIDELNRLLEHAESQHHDTDATSAALWTFIDQMHKNNKFFFIGTMNRLTKLPKPYKSRILFEYILFPAFENSAQKIAVIRNRLTDTITQIDPAVTDPMLEAELQQLGECSQRDLKKLASFTRRLYRQKEDVRSACIVINLELIKDAVAQCKIRKDLTEYDVEDKTTEERQDAQHAENIELSKKHFEAQQKLQKDLHAENLAHQQKQFKNQQLIQMTMNENQGSVYRPSISVGPVPALNIAPVRQELTARGREQVLNMLDGGQYVAPRANCALRVCYSGAVVFCCLNYVGYRAIRSVLKCFGASMAQKEQEKTKNA